MYLIRSFITLYCCCSLCRIFKVSSEFFAVIGPISDSFKMLKKLRHVSEPFKLLRPKKQLQEHKHVQNRCEQCYPRWRTREIPKIIITFQTYLFNQAKSNLTRTKIFFFVHKRQMTFWVGNIDMYIYTGSSRSYYLINRISSFCLLRRIFLNHAQVKKTRRGNHL